jgi:formate dehydrogenase subunit gamma
MGAALHRGDSSQIGLSYLEEGVMVNNGAGSLAPPEGPRSTDNEMTALDSWVPRFGLTERLAHWWTAAMVSAALLTGLAMGDEGGSGPMLWRHVLPVGLIGAGMVGALIFGSRRALLRTARRLLVFDGRDLAWLRARLRSPLDRTGEPEWGMFNAGQKLLAWMLAASFGAVIVTGIQSWSAGGEGGLHGAAVVATMGLLGAHLFMAVVNPATRPALAGMVFGRVRRPWAAKHHSEWLKDLAR